MAFPTNPVNGQSYSSNGAVYVYNSTKNAWIKNNYTGVTLTANSLILTSNVESGSTTSGAHVVNGGAGIVGRLNVGGNVVLSSGTTSTSSTTGALVVTGGIGVSGNIIVGGDIEVPGRAILGSGTTSNVVVSATTTSTSTTTGALVVRGGAGIAGNIVVGDSIINTVAAGFGSVSSRFTANTGSKADFHISTSIYGASSTATQQYGITLAIPTGATQAAILISENTSDGTAIGFFTTNSYATGPQFRAQIDPTGHFLPAANVTYDLGSTSLRWRNIYTGDLNLSNGRGDYTIVEGEEDLFLYNNRTGKTYKFVVQEVDPSVVPRKLS